MDQNNFVNIHNSWYNSGNSNSNNIEYYGYYSQNNVTNSQDLIINGGYLLDPYLIMKDENEMKMNEAIALNSTLNPTIAEFVPYTVNSGNTSYGNDINIDSRRELPPIFNPIQRNYNKILTPYEVSSLLIGFTRYYVPWNNVDRIQNIIKLFYFPNEDIGLIRGQRGYVNILSTDMYYDTNISQKLTNVAGYNSEFEVVSETPFYKNSSMSIYVQIRILKLVELYGRASLDEIKERVYYINKGGIVLIKWEDTSLCNIYKREMYQKLNRFDVTGLDLFQCKQGILNPNTIIYATLDDLISKRTDNVCAFAEPIQFRLLNPDFNDINELFGNEILFCYFDKIQQCGYIRIEDTHWMTQINNIEFNRITFQLNHYNCMPIITGYSNDIRFDCLSLMFLSTNIYVNESDHEMIKVKCIDRDPMVYGKSCWINISSIMNIGLIPLSKYITQCKKSYKIKSIYKGSNNLCINSNRGGIMFGHDSGIITDTITDAVQDYRHHSSSIIGTFYEHNKFTIMDNEIKVHLNNEYIKVKLMIQEWYHNECHIDFKLKNKECYILLTSTNLV